MQMKSWLLAAALSGIAVLGCGDDGGGSGGVSGSKKIADLTASEQKSLCKSFEAKAKKIDAALIEVECTAEGLEAEDACEEERDACIEDTEPESDLECDDAPEDAVNGDDCDVTVKQFEACLDALVNMAEDLADELTCDLEEEPEEGDIPKACTDLADDCPMLMDLAGA